MNKITEDVGDLGIRELGRTVRMTDTSIIPYGVDLVLDGRVAYPLTPPNTVETPEDLGCVTVS